MTKRLVRTSLANYDADFVPSVDLVADDADDDLAVPRLKLLKDLFPRTKDRIVGLHLISTPGFGQPERFLVTLEKGGRVVVQVGSVEAIERLSEATRAVGKATHNDDRIVKEARKPVHAMGMAALCLTTVRGGEDLTCPEEDELAPTFMDEVSRALTDLQAGSHPASDLLWRGGRQLWQRGAPLHTLALSTAERTRGYSFAGRQGFVAEMLSAIVTRIVKLTPSEDHTLLSSEEREADEYDEFVSRCSPQLLELLEEFRAAAFAPEWSSSKRGFGAGLFSHGAAALIGDDACAPLVGCLRLLREVASDEWSSTCPALPPWTGAWLPMRVRAHGNLVADNIAIDAGRRLHLTGLEYSRMAPAFFDVARLVPHLLCASVSLDDKGERTMCRCIDALLLPNLPLRTSLGGKEIPYAETSSYGSLLMIGAVPLADVMPEKTPSEIKAVVLMAQQMIDSACKMVMSAGVGLGRVDEHDVHPISLLLPLLLHALHLCQFTDLSQAQQRVAWHIVLRASSMITVVLGDTVEASSLPAAPAVVAAARTGSAAGEAALRHEHEDAKREAGTALAFQKTVTDQLALELSEQVTISVSEPLPEGGGSSQATGSPAAPQASTATPSKAATKNKGGGHKTRKDGLKTKREGSPAGAGGSKGKSASKQRTARAALS